MSTRSKLFAAIKNNPKNVRFDDLTSLIKGLGWKLTRQTGSHQRFDHAVHASSQFTLQYDKNGMAKEYQVKQVLEAIAALKIEVK